MKRAGHRFWQEFLCEDYFAYASPAVHREFDTLLLACAVSGGPGRLALTGCVYKPPLTPISPRPRTKVRS
ncbi:hypothetical protein Areg01_81670 [Actinoplanes regularis]|nr:hypothetical protein Areg01_81670 [Actinoplanes regularis]